MTTYAGSVSFPGLITIPDDGVPDTAADFNVGLEGLADRTVYLNAGLVAAEANIATDEANIATNTAAIAALTIRDQRYIADYVTHAGDGSGFTGLSISLADGGLLSTPTVFLNGVVATHVGDLFEIDLCAEYALDSVSGTAVCAVKLQASQNGAGFVDIFGASTHLRANGVAGIFTTGNFVLKGVGAIATAGTFDIRVMAMLTAHSTGDTFAANTNITGAYRLLRSP